MISVSKKLGVGLYSPSEAALYARVAPQLMSRWLFGTKRDEPVIQPQLSDSERLVTFLDFVQAMAIRAIRIVKNVPLQTIREAVEKARTKYDIEYPFAVEHTTYLFGSEILIRRPDDNLEQVTGKRSGQLMVKVVAELYMDDLSFGANGLASKYTAWKERDLEIVMDPQIRFGEPLLTSCHYSAQTLWEAYKAEGGIENAAKAYGVSNDDVKLACKYFDHLLGNTAA